MNGYLLLIAAAIAAYYGAQPSTVQVPAVLPPTKPKATPPTGKDYKSLYIAKCWDNATEVSKEAGWSRDLLLAQSANESDWGRSLLASKYNNLFGIKAGKEWNGGKTPPLWTSEVINGRSVRVQAPFRSYANWADSMRDWMDFLKRYPRYFKAISAAQAGDAAGFFKGLREAGYATEPDYDTRLASFYQQVQGSIA